jgi:hypothetical protein
MAQANSVGASFGGTECIPETQPLEDMDDGAVDATDHAAGVQEQGALQYCMFSVAHG